MSEKVKYESEFIIKTSPKILYNMLSTPSGLAEWFADDVNVNSDQYTFVWESSEEEARLISRKSPDFIKFQWLEDEEEDEDYFFEFRIKIDPMTQEVALIITDYCVPGEEEEGRALWGSQVNELKQTIGA